MEQSSRNFKLSSINRKFWVAFASLNRYFTENSRWVPLMSPKRVLLTFGTFKMSFPLKAYVVSLNEINSFKVSGSFYKSRVDKPNRGFYSISAPCRWVLLLKSLRSSSNVVRLSLNANWTALSLNFSSFSAEPLLQKCQVCARQSKCRYSFLYRKAKTATC